MLISLPSVIPLSHLTYSKNNTHTPVALFRDYSGEPYQKGKTNLDFTEARHSEWPWHKHRINNNNNNNDRLMAFDPGQPG